MKNKNVKTLQDIDASYLAGLIDGEGTIGLSVHKRGENRHPVVSIANTDYVLVEWPQQVTGVGFICKKGSKKEEHHLDSYIYAVHSDQALEVLQQIYPYLKNKSKKARTQLLLTKYKQVTPRNGKYSTELLAERKKFESQFLSL